MQKRFPRWSFLALCGLAACGGPEPSGAAGDASESTRRNEPTAEQGETEGGHEGDEQRVATDGGTFEVVWAPVGDAIPKNRHFELDLWVLREGKPVEGARVHLHAHMPDHGHGMNTEPRIVAKEANRHRVKGMLFHMGGLWEIEVRVGTEPGVNEMARIEVVL